MNKLKKGFLVIGSALGVSNAYAAPVDFTSITAAVDLSTTEAAILAIGATMAGFYVGRKALNLVLGMLRTKG